MANQQSRLHHQTELDPWSAMYLSALTCFSCKRKGSQNDDLGHGVFKLERTFVCGWSNPLAYRFPVSTFFFFWLRWVFAAVHRLSLVVVSRGYSFCGVWASHCGGFSYCGARALGAWASVVVVHGLQ